MSRLLNFFFLLLILATGGGAAQESNDPSVSHIHALDIVVNQVNRINTN